MAGDGGDPPFILEYWSRLGGEKNLNLCCQFGYVVSI